MARIDLAVNPNRLVLGGLLDSAEISESFAEYFSGICRPNSGETNTLLRSKFEEKFTNYVGDSVCQDGFFFL